MNDIPITDKLIEWLRNHYQISNSNQFLSQVKCSCEIPNNFLKNDSKYSHVQYLRSLPNIVNEHGGYGINEDPFNPFIKRFPYKKSINDRVKITVSSNKFRKSKIIFLLKFSFCTKVDECFSDICKKIKKMSNEELKRLTKVYIVHNDGSGKIELNLEKNTTQKANGFKVYDIMIKDEINEYKFCDPFSLICFRQISKRCNHSLIGKHYRRLMLKKANCLKYYMNIIFIQKSSLFNDNFIYHLNFYKVIEVNDGDFCNLCSINNLIPYSNSNQNITNSNNPNLININNPNLNSINNPNLNSINNPNLISINNPNLTSINNPNLTSINNPNLTSINSPNLTEINDNTIYYYNIYYLLTTDPNLYSIIEHYINNYNKKLISNNFN